MRALLVTLAVVLASLASAAAAQTSKFGIPSTNGAGGTQLLASTVAQLPTCDVSHIGILRVVTDAAATPVYNTAAVGGGTVTAMVVCSSAGTWMKQ
jgi:hypothetical protein